MGYLWDLTPEGGRIARELGGWLASDLHGCINVAILLVPVAKGKRGSNASARPNASECTRIWGWQAEDGRQRMAEYSTDG